MLPGIKHIWRYCILIFCLSYADLTLAFFLHVNWDATKYTVISKDLNGDRAPDLFFLPTAPGVMAHYIMNQPVIWFPPPRPRPPPGLPPLPPPIPPPPLLRPDPVFLYGIEPPYYDYSQEIDWLNGQVSFVKTNSFYPADIIIQQGDGKLYYGVSPTQNGPYRRAELHGYYFYELKDYFDIEHYDELANPNRVKLHIGSFSGGEFDEVFAQGINGHDKYVFYYVENVPIGGFGSVERNTLFPVQEWSGKYLDTLWDNHHNTIIVGRFANEDKDSLMLVSQPSLKILPVAGMIPFKIPAPITSRVFTTNEFHEFSDTPLSFEWDAHPLLKTINHYKLHSGDFDNDGIDELFLQAKIKNDMSFYAVIQDDNTVSLIPATPAGPMEGLDISTNSYQLTTDSFFSPNSKDTLFFHSNQVANAASMAVQDSAGSIFPIPYRYGNDVSLIYKDIKLTSTAPDRGSPDPYTYQFTVTTLNMTDCSGAYAIVTRTPTGIEIGPYIDLPFFLINENGPLQTFQSPLVVSWDSIDAFRLQVSCNNSVLNISDSIEVPVSEGGPGSGKPRYGIPDGSD